MTKNSSTFTSFLKVSVVSITLCLILSATLLTAQTKRCSPVEENDLCDSQETVLGFIKPYKCSGKYYVSATDTCVWSVFVGKCATELEECNGCKCRPEHAEADGDMCRCVLSD